MRRSSAKSASKHLIEQPALPGSDLSRKVENEQPNSLAGTPADGAATAAALAQADEGIGQQQVKQTGVAAPAGRTGKTAVPAKGPAASQGAATAATAAQLEQRRHKKQRVLVDMHGSGTAPAQHHDPGTVENEYERQRLERIRRNQAMLEELGINQAASGLAVTVQQQRQHLRAQAGSNAGPRRPRQRAAPAAARPLEPRPTRQSARQRGLHLNAAGSVDAAAAAAASTPAEPEPALLELEEYYKLAGVDASKAVVVDERLYYGWVNPEVCTRYGLAGSAAEAWEAGGGGKFSYKIDKSAIPAHLKSKGWSDARAFAATQLQKNPNTYFYRHVAPHEQQAQGEWTTEEHELFLETARKNGAGVKWGLFASHLPQRVGYQCSAYYRDVMLPQGLIIDHRFRMTRAGKAVFVG